MIESSIANRAIDWPEWKRIEQTKLEEAAHTRWINSRGPRLNADPEKHAYAGMETNLDTRYETTIMWRKVAGDDYFHSDYLKLRKMAYWEYQNHQNKGECSGDRWNKRLDTIRQKMDLIDSLASRLDLNRYQRSRVKGLFSGINAGKGGIFLELFAYCACCYILKEKDDRCLRETHPQSSNRDELYEQLEQELLIELLGCRHRDVVKTYGKVQSFAQRQTRKNTV